MQSAIIYFTGGVKYSVPDSLALTYIFGVIRVLLFAYVLSYFFQADFTPIIAAVSVLFADFRFYLDFSDYMTNIDEDVDDIDSDQ